MNIALMGTRGIPANYSGFETFYEELATRLVARGHIVTVYNRPHHVKYREKTYKGVRLVHMPSLPTKHLDTITHSALSALHGLFCAYDIVYFCGVGNAPVAWIPRLSGAKVLLNVDSNDWKRDKWGRFARFYLRTMEKAVARTANVLIADSKAIQARYRELYGFETVYIPYGANVVSTEKTDALEKWNLRPREYVMWVGRTVPESRVDELILAFRQLSRNGTKLVIVGDAPFSEEYKERIRGLANEHVVFTGYAFGDTYRQLSCNAKCFVFPSPVSGTSPALLDQMGFGNCVIVRATPTNLEVIGDAGLSYDPEDPVNDLARRLDEVFENPSLVDTYRRLATERVRSIYSWDTITDRYEELFAQLAGKRAWENRD